jgi:SAM-dependent methyltransferase
MERANFPCRLCGGDDLRLFYTQGNDARYRYFRCADCELVNIDLAAGMDQSQCNLMFRDPTDETAGWDRMLDVSFSRIQRHLPSTRSLCDIGCGNGRLLYLAKNAGWRVFGLELTEEVAERTAMHLGVDVAGGDFLTYEPPTEHAQAYDVVCLRHVLEHLPDSLLAMKRISALLKPGGHALLEFPNIDALDKRIKRMFVNSGLHRRSFKTGFAPGHCNEFSRSSFEFLLARSGFTLVHWETYSKKPIRNLIYNYIHVGNKARALVRKSEQATTAASR